MAFMPKFIGSFIARALVGASLLVAAAALAWHATRLRH